MTKLAIKSRLLSGLGVASAAFAAATGCATGDPRENLSAELETPSYKAAERDGRFELRQYQPHVTAEVTVEGDLDEASNKGFRVLAGYIFGDNKQKTEMAMTAPVDAVPLPTMDDVEAAGPVSAARAGSTWKIAFMMPSAYALEDLPEPEDQRIELVQRPASCRAAVVFDGFTSDDRIATETAALEAWLENKGLKPSAAPTVARYNDPFTFPWNRRNEILVDVNAATCDAGKPQGS